MHVTLIAAGILGLWLVWLGISVARLRLRYQISLGDGENADMTTAVRAHGNAAEWIPAGLILLFLAEQAYGARCFVVLLGAAFVIGRIVHPFGLKVRTKNAARSTGMILTFLAVAILSVLLLIHAAGLTRSWVAGA